jgi:hypothetical protein
VRTLHPEVVLGADPAAARTGAPARGRGAEGVAGMFAGRALAAPPATVDGRPGIVWAVAGQPKIVWDWAFSDDRILRMRMTADVDALRDMRVEILVAESGADPAAPPD